MYMLRGSESAFSCWLRMALLQHFFADVEDEERVRMAQRLLGKLKAPASPGDFTQLKSLLPCLRLLAEEPDAKAFEDLSVQVEDHHRQEAIVKRFGLSRAAAENATPVAIKLLKPKVKGCTIVWQATEATFSGSYPKPMKPTKTGKQSKAKAQEHGTRRSYGGGKWTQLQALLKVVNRLWELHKTYGGATCHS